MEPPNEFENMFRWELVICLDCQICVWNWCTTKVWSEFEGKNL